MKQVVVIGGGDSYSTYEEYFAHLQSIKFDLDRIRPGKSWKAHLPENLGTDYDVLTPRMPTPENARYAEWELWFEKITPFLTDGAVLIGHSLGACFLARYLAENDLPFKPSGVFLLAGPHDPMEGVSEEFAVPTPLTRLAAYGARVFLYHSEDDPVVSFSELAKYASALPDATTRVFEDRGHFIAQDTFPELVADIKSLS